ncbi:ketoacyl-ACP synthase III family protein [Herbidospora mongoliensis]|uniref:ketoacyl-ACP synthase III family protein n=1 Tax=Herbidospora mongoliensis TaxID=688067 RepID=UPI000833CACE|nr:ketoacyl-ACP synthase III family protein [Herbidospora mongoliensis]
MRFDDIWVAGTGGTLGERVPVERAVACGDYSADAAKSTGQVSVSMSRQAPPEMAVSAGRRAIKSAEDGGAVLDPDTFYLHSHSHFQGVDMWPAACWIAGELLGTDLRGMPMSVQAASNGSLGSLEIAANMLTARPEVPSALITVADRFAPPADRWYLSPGMVFGDGAAAAVLTRSSGRLRLRSLVSETDATLEGLSRGDEPFRSAPQPGADMRNRTRSFLAHSGLSLKDVRRRSADRTHSVVTRALDDAGKSLDEIDWFVAPFVGRALYQDSFIRPFDGFTPRNTLLELGLSTGHLGPADGLYALHHLIRDDLIAPGASVLVLGTGMGFTFSAAVLTREDTQCVR